MKNMFTDSFERINANFKKIFTELSVVVSASLFSQIQTMSLNVVLR